MLQNAQILPAHEDLPTRYDPPHVALCFLLAPLMAIAPRTIAQRLVGLPLWKAAVIGIFYFSLAVPFLKPITYERMVAELFYGHPMPFLVVWLAGAVCVQWLAILPFAGRPGSDRATVIHATRTVLLMTFWLPLSGLIITNLLGVLSPYLKIMFSPEFIASASAVVLTLTALWTICVIRALGVEYRTSADLAAPRDPLCDECGYDLAMAPDDGRCPECGKPVAESLSATSRLASRWEKNPSLLNPAQIWWQFKTLFTHPRKFFASIPLRTDHAAARKWLIFSLILVGLAASLVGPGLFLVDPNPIEFTWNNSWLLFMISYDIGLTWILLALVMVGIETGGMAIIGHFRDFPIDLSCTAKVTSYASTYMLAWVFLGGIQILGAYWWTLTPGFKHVSERVQTLVGFGSGAFFHIAGLVVFEWVVYAGLRKIQFANK